MSLLGWRQWAVDRGGLLRPAWTPWSPFPPELLLWRPDGITRAHCLRGPHAAPAAREERPAERPMPDPVTAAPKPGTVWAGAPDENCVCGLYAWRDPATLARAPHPRWTRLPIVVGVVRLGGRIIVGERGYRAERGYPVAVLDPARAVAPTYQVARYRDWRALVAEWHEEPSAAA